MLTATAPTAARGAEEQSWIRAAQEGDARAYASLVDRYWPRLQRWLHGQTQDSQAAEDVTQDTFLKVWSNLNSFTAGSNFRAWLFCIARRCLIDSRRRGRSPAAGQLHDSAAASGPGPVHAAVARETLARVQLAVARLPAHLREVLLLRTQEGLAYADIARELGLSEETTRWRVMKARQALLERLGESPDSERTLRKKA
jgi:RNA polymerase sigma-70 factor (ECF subfamily)